MKTIAFTNQKGGVGKTTTCINLAAALGKMGQRILLIDIDPQGNATTGSGINKQAQQQGLYGALMGDVEPVDAVMTTDFLYDIIPANRDLSGAEIELAATESREWQLKRVIHAVQTQKEYDLVLIDCPPSLSLLTINALCAADYMFIPMQCEYYALEGLSDLMSTFKRIREHLHPELAVLGLVLTMYDPRNLLALQVQETLSQHFLDKLFRTTIPRNIRLAESPSHGRPVLHYDSKARGAIAYQECAEELLARLTS